MSRRFSLLQEPGEELLVYYSSCCYDLHFGIPIACRPKRTNDWTQDKDHVVDEDKERLLNIPTSFIPSVKRIGNHAMLGGSMLGLYHHLFVGQENQLILPYPIIRALISDLCQTVPNTMARAYEKEQ